MTGPDRSAGFQPAVLGASRPQFGSVTIRDRGYLPHWEAEGACYFITFRLADSLPSAVSQAMHAERQLLATSAARRDLLEVERRRAQKLSSRRLEALLDEGSGSCPLRNPAVAEIVSNALRFWKDKRYRLLAWVVMPNHVHVVLKLFPGEKLASIVHSWKSFTAREANRALRRRGEFWEREYYDHLIRNENELQRAVDYVQRNPSAAGLTPWEWVGRE